MRSIWLVVLVLGCGGHAAMTVDGGGGGDSGGGSGGDAAAAFCDGTPHSIGSVYVQSLAVDAQGRLLVLGTQAQPRETLAVRRFQPDGALDTTFADAGVATTPDASDAGAFALAPNGDIIVGGALVTGTGVNLIDSPLLLGLDDTGQPTALHVTQPATSMDRKIWNVMLQGSSYVVNIEGVLDRIGADGSFDATFGDGGGPGLDPVAQTTDGFIIASSELGKLGLYRLTADGQQVAGSAAMLDTNTWKIDAAITHGDDATLVGEVMPAGTQIVVGRILADGTPDTASYGPTGFVVLDAGPADQPTAAVQLPDGTVLVAGESNGSAGVARVAPDGTLAHTYVFGGGDTTLGAVAVWNGMIAVGGNTTQSGMIACLPR